MCWWVSVLQSWNQMSPPHQCRVHCWCRRGRTDTVPRAARARLHFTQPQWACLKDIFTGISSQTAVVLWGQTEINDGRDPINACAITKLHSRQIRKEGVVFVPCIFCSWKSLINWTAHVYRFMRDQTRAREVKYSSIISWESIALMRWWMESTQPVSVSTLWY